jgi:hypothetical protein
MTNTKKKKEAMLEALEKSLGVVTNAAKAAGIHRDTHYNWIRKDEEYKAKVEELQEVALDFAESSLYKQIRDGNVTATIFYLKTRGKKRGYVERQEISQVGETKIVVEPLSESALKAIEDIIADA